MKQQRSNVITGAKQNKTTKETTNKNSRCQTTAQSRGSVQYVCPWTQIIDYRLLQWSGCCNVVFTALCGKSVRQLRPQNDLHGASHQCSSDLCTGFLFVRVLILKYHCGVYEAPNGLRPKYILVHFLQLGFEPPSALRTEPGEAEFSYRTSDSLKNTLYSFKFCSVQKQSSQ